MSNLTYLGTSTVEAYSVIVVRGSTRLLIDGYLPLTILAAVMGTSYLVAIEE